MLVTLADMKDYLGIPSGNTSNDAFLTQQLQLTSDVVEAYCGRKFEVGSYIQTFYRSDFPDNTTSLKLMQYPLISMTSLEIDDTAITSDFRLHYPTATVTLERQFFFGEKVEVSYSAGYATIPSFIQYVVMSIVQEKYNKKSAGVSLSFGSDVQSISIPGTISIAYDYSLTSNERTNKYGSFLGQYANMLDPHRSERAVIGSGTLQYVT